MSMTGYTITVAVPDMETFKAYWYTYGDVTSVRVQDGGTGLLVTVDYGTDHYRAQYQLDRFASGLYFGTIDEYSTEDDERLSEN